MAIINDIIRDALSSLGVVGHGQPLPPEESKHGLRMLNSLLSSWEANGFLQYVPAQSTAEEFAFSPDMDLAVTSHLAMLLAPHYGARIPETVAGAAATEYARMLRDKMNAQLQPVTVANVSIGEARWPTLE